MAKFDIQRVISKGMRVDDGYENTPNGTYTQAVNLRDSTIAGTSLERIKGTSIQFEVPNVTTTAQIIKVSYANFIEGVTPNLTLVYATLPNTINFTQNNQEWAGPNASFLISQAGDKYAIDVSEYNDANNYTVYISLNASSADVNSQFDNFNVYTSNSVLSVKQSQENLYNTDYHLGQLKPIGGIELGNSLYVFSAISEDFSGGYGEIGRFDTLTNTYTKILGSKQLNFSTRYQIDCDGEVRNNNPYIYFTDNYNSVRVININDDLLADIDYSNFIANLVLSQSSGTPCYWSMSTGSTIKGSITTLFGEGNITSGTYRYAIRFKDSNYTPKGWSTLSSGVEAHTNKRIGQSTYVGTTGIGDYTSQTGACTINLSFENIDLSTNKYIDVIMVHYNGSFGGTPSGGFIKENIPLTSSNFVFSHTNELELAAISLEEVLALLENVSSGISLAKNIRIINNRLVLANVRKTESNDALKNWAKSIHIYDDLRGIKPQKFANGYSKYDKKNPTDKKIVSTTEVNEFHPRTNNKQHKTGYMPFEEYRFGVQVQLKNGDWSDTYHIKDHRFDMGADTGETRPSSKYIYPETNNSGGRFLRLDATAISNGHSFVNDGFVPGMKIAIQDENEGQTKASINTYYNNVVNGTSDEQCPTPGNCVNHENLGSWYNGGSLLDFRRRLYYGNNGASSQLKTPYFVIKSVDDDKIELEKYIGGQFYWCEPAPSDPDLRFRVSSVYYLENTSNSVFDNQYYTSSHPMRNSSKLFSLHPKFVVNTSPVKDLINGYRILRAPVEKEVLASGLAVVAENGLDCDAGFTQSTTEEQNKSFYFPMVTSNSYAQKEMGAAVRLKTGNTTNADGYKTHHGTGKNSHISPIFNAFSVNHTEGSFNHTPGDGQDQSIIPTPGYFQTTTTNITSVPSTFPTIGKVDSKNAINRPHPCVLDRTDLTNSGNGTNDFDGTDFVDYHNNIDSNSDSIYTPHYYSGRNIVYFHSPDFDYQDANETGGGQFGFEKEHKFTGAKDKLINLGRAYHSTYVSGPTDGDHTADYKSNQHGPFNPNGSGLATETSNGTSGAYLSQRTVLSANIGYPFIVGQSETSGAGYDGLNSHGGSADEIYDGESPTIQPIASTDVIASGTQDLIKMKSVDSHFLFCNLVPQLTMYGEGNPSNPRYMAQPGLPRKTFKHWMFYNIDDSQHTSSVSSVSHGKGKRVFLNNSRLGTVEANTGLSYGSGNDKDSDGGESTVKIGSSTSYSRRTKLAETKSMPFMTDILNPSPQEGTKGDKYAYGMTSDCMVLSVVNQYSTPKTDTFGESTTIAGFNGSPTPNSSFGSLDVPVIDEGNIGLNDGGGRQVNKLDRGQKRFYAGTAGSSHGVKSKNFYERSIFHNWAAFADRGQQSSDGISYSTLQLSDSGRKQSTGGYGWNRMHDDTGMYMAMYFREKSIYEKDVDGNDIWSESGSKYGPLDTTEYIEIGHYRDITILEGGSITECVFGGDTMVQHTFKKLTGTPETTPNTRHPWSNYTTTDGGTTKVIDQEVITGETACELSGHEGEWGHVGGDDTDLVGTSSEAKQKIIEAHGGILPNQSRDMWSNSMVAVYSFNRVNTQSRTYYGVTSDNNDNYITSINADYSLNGTPFLTSRSFLSLLFSRYSLHRQLHLNLKSTVSGTSMFNYCNFGQINTNSLFSYQNLIPSYMTNANAQPTQALHENTGVSKWGVKGFDSSDGVSFSDMNGFDKLLINPAYNVNESYIGVHKAHSINSSLINTLKARIYYSAEKQGNSTIDAYRQIPETNRLDLDVKYGSINNLSILNGEIYAIQEKSLIRLFMKDRTILNGNESATEIILGTSEVFSQRYKILSQYGTREKWSVVVGKDETGNDVLVYIDTTNSKVIRFDDKKGVSVISDLFGVSKDLKRLCSGMDAFELSNPTGVGGITSVWDEENGEFLFSWNVNFDSSLIEVIDFNTDESGNDGVLGSDPTITGDISETTEDEDGIIIDSDSGDVVDAEDEVDLEDESEEEVNNVDEDIVDLFDDYTEEEGGSNPDGNNGVGDDPNSDEEFGIDEVQEEDDTDETYLNNDEDGSEFDADDVYGGVAVDYDGPDESTYSSDSGNLFSVAGDKIPYSTEISDIESLISGVINKFDEADDYFAPLLDDVYTLTGKQRASVNDFIRKTFVGSGGRLLLQNVTQVLRFINTIKSTPFDEKTPLTSKNPIKTDTLSTDRYENATKQFIENYTTKVSVSNLNRPVPTTDGGNIKNDFEDKSRGHKANSLTTSVTPTNKIFDFDTTRPNTLIASDGEVSRVSGTSNRDIAMILGLENPVKKTTPLYYNSKFKVDEKYWDFITTSNSSYNYSRGKGIKIFASETADKVSISPKLGAPATATITFTNTPNADSVISITNNYGKTRKFKAVNQGLASLSGTNRDTGFSKLISGVVDSDNTIKYERGHLETGATNQKQATANALAYAIKTAFRETVLLHLDVAFVINLVQNKIGSDGNNTIQSTGTTNATIVGFVNGVGGKGLSMPGFITNARHRVGFNGSAFVSSSTFVKPYKQGDVVQVITEFDVDTSTHSNAVVRINETSNAVGTTDASGYVLTLANGFNKHIKYVRLTSANPIVNLNVSRANINLRRFQVRKWNGNYFKVGTQATNSKYLAIQAGTPQAVYAMKNSASGSKYKTRLLTSEKNAKLLLGHTIIMAVSVNNTFSNSKLFSVSKDSNSADLFSLNLTSTNSGQPFFVGSATSGSTSQTAVQFSKNNGYFNSEFTDSLGDINIFVAKYNRTADSYTVTANGFTTATVISGCGLQSVNDLIMQIQPYENASILRLQVFDEELTNPNIEKAISRISSDLKVSLNHAFATSYVTRNSVLGGVANRVITSSKNATVDNAIVRNIITQNSTTSTLYKNVHNDASVATTRDVGGVNSIPLFVEAKIRIISFNGGAVGTSNGPDAFTLAIAITGTGTSITSIDSVSKTIQQVQAEQGAGYVTIKALCKYQKTAPFTLAITSTRTSSVNSAEIEYEVSELKGVKGFDFNIPTVINGKPVMAKVKTPSSTKFYVRTPGTVLLGSAKSVNDFATINNPIKQSGKWTLIKQSTPSFMADDLNPNINNIGDTSVASNIDTSTVSYTDGVLNEAAENLNNTVTVATLVYNERKKKFNGYYSFNPSIYIKSKDSYFTHNTQYQETNPSSTMKLWNHNKLSSNFGEFYGISYKSHIFIPFNEVSHNQKTMYSALLNGTSSSAADLTTKFYAVKVTGDSYVLLDAGIDGVVEKKDDYYTLTPQDRLHGKAFVIKISSTASNTSYIKINGVIARLRAQSPIREMKGQQDMRKLFQQRKK